MSTSALTSSSVQVKPKRSFFRSGREDSPFKRIIIHVVLIIASIVSIFPVLRVLAVSLRPGDRLVVEGHRDVEDGQKVKIVKAATAVKDLMP